MTESPEIKTYGPDDFEDEGVPEGFYVLCEDGEPRTVIPIPELGSIGAWLIDNGYDDGWVNLTAVGPVSTDEIIPAVTEYRKRRTAQDLTGDPSHPQADIFLKAQAALYAALRELRNARGAEKKAAEMFVGDPHLPEIMYQADGLLLITLGNLQKMERDLRKATEGARTDG